MSTVEGFHCSTHLEFEAIGEPPPILGHSHHVVPGSGGAEPPLPGLGVHPGCRLSRPGRPPRGQLAPRGGGGQELVLRGRDEGLKSYPHSQPSPKQLKEGVLQMLKEV